MKDFLEEHGSEVVNMLSQEFDIEVARKVWQQEAEERGVKKGEKKGVKKGEKKGIEKIAREAIKINMPVEDIAKITGLTVNQIENLKK